MIRCQVLSGVSSTKQTLAYGTLGTKLVNSFSARGGLPVSWRLHVSKVPACPTKKRLPKKNFMNKNFINDYFTGKAISSKI